MLVRTDKNTTRSSLQQDSYSLRTGRNHDHIVKIVGFMNS